MSVQKIFTASRNCQQTAALRRYTGVHAEGDITPILIRTKCLQYDLQKALKQGHFMWTQ